MKCGQIYCDRQADIGGKSCFEHIPGDDVCEISSCNNNSIGWSLYCIRHKNLSEDLCSLRLEQFIHIFYIVKKNIHHSK